MGCIGLVTYNRLGGHREHGFLMAKGPRISPESSFADGRTVDVGSHHLRSYH